MPSIFSIQCRVNGVVKQHANTGDLLFRIPPIQAYLSNGITLEPGDLISTGTPSGVGYTRTPPSTRSPAMSSRSRSKESAHSATGWRMFGSGKGPFQWRDWMLGQSIEASRCSVKALRAIGLASRYANGTLSR